MGRVSLICLCWMTVYLTLSCGPIETTPQENQLSEERQKLEDLKKNLQSLENKKAQQQQQMTLTYPNQISKSTAEIEDLYNLLEEHRWAENDINHATQMTLGQQSSQARFQWEQIENEIQSLQESLRHDQEELQIRSYFPAVTPEQRTDIENLRDRLSSQRQRLEELHNQKLSFSSTLLQRSQQVAADAEQRKSELQENAADIQDQISNLRQDIVRLQSESLRIKTSSASLDQQILQQRQNLFQQEAIVKKLETSLLDSEASSRHRDQ